MSIDPAKFARECVRQGVFFGVNPHYMLGVAELRSGISDDSDNDLIGPFRLKQAEWDANSNDDTFDVHFAPAQISDPFKQCVVFALMAQRAFDAFNKKNGRNPSAKELYLQQYPGGTSATFAADFQKALNDTANLIGPAADALLGDPNAVSTITNPDSTINPDSSTTLTIGMLHKLWPRAAPALVQGMMDTAPKVFSQCGINTPMRLAHFMAQISEECDAGTEMVEDLIYTAENMMHVFPRKFPTLESTVGFVHNEKALGDKVYNGMNGNRDGTDDGFFFRGHGCLQLTGRDSYVEIGNICGLDLVNNPDLAVDPQNALLVAAKEFVQLGCLAECDNDNVVQVSARVNLGHPTSSPGLIHGLEERKAWLVKWKRELNIS